MLLKPLHNVIFLDILKKIFVFLLFKRHPHKMVKHTLTVFGYFVGLALKGLSSNCSFLLKEINNLRYSVPDILQH